MSYNIGIDFGGVLSVHDGGNTEHKNTCINMPNAKESLEQMKNNGHNLSIVSFCGRSRANETFASLKENELDTMFHSQYYVKKRDSKSGICLYKGIQIMIDDRTEILDDISANGPDGIITIWFGSKESHPVHKSAKDWTEVLEIIDKIKSEKIKINNEIIPVPSININKLCYLHTV